MKKVVILGAIALLALGLSSCKDDKNKQWDANAMVSLRAAQTAQGVASKADGHLTPLEIVETAINIQWYHKPTSPNPLGRTFSETQRDLVNVRLLMFGTDIIAQDGTYETGFIKGEDIVITQGNNADTIAYIPNAVLQAADIAIKSAYDAGDYETCYALFDKAFTFIPITGAEWRELKAKGEN